MNPEIKIKALIIEDNPTQANMLRISLTRRGFEVECLAYLAHGLERLGRGGIDVVLLDLSLPDSDGIETFYEIYNRAPEVPIVVLSGMNDHSVAQAALEGGAQDYLVKGVPSDESISRCLRYAIERHRFERKIWESERTTRLIVENAHDAFVSMDARGFITGWNIKAEMIFGWYKKDAIGRPILEVMFPESVRAFFYQQIQAFLNGERGNLVNNRVETMLLRKDGSQFPAELAMFPVTMGSTYTLCGFVQDISDRKMVEQRLQQINGQLEVLVDERTVELNETVSNLQQFARQTSHELQEPLVAMQSIALNLARNLQNSGNPQAEEQIDRLLEIANAMVGTVQALADNGHGRKLDEPTAPPQVPHFQPQVPHVQSAMISQPSQPTGQPQLPPIAQINLPDQMVPTSNVPTQILNSSSGRATRVLPAVSKKPDSPNVTKILPAMERPQPNQKQQI